MKNISNTKSHLTSARKKDLLFYLAIIAIPVVQICIFYVYVNFNSILLAFKEYSADGSVSFAGFNNFANVFEKFFSDPIASEQWKTSFTNSLILLGARLLISLPLSLLCSYYIAKKGPGFKFFRSILFLPGIVSSVVLTMVFKFLIDDAILPAFGVEAIFNKHDMTTFFVILAYCVFVELGSKVLLLSSSMGEIDEGIIEAAKLDGVNSLQEFFIIYVPMIWPMIITFVVSTMAAMFTDQMMLFTFYKGHVGSSMWTVGYNLFNQTYSNVSSIAQYPYLSALGLVLTALTITFTFSVRALMRKFGPKEN